MRLYKSVRLALVTSVWVDELLFIKEKELQDKLTEGLADDAEDVLLKEFPFLNGVSRNISFKVSFSSIVEMCYRNTINYSLEDWEQLVIEMDNFKAPYTDKDTTTPKLYLDETIWTGLESYQRKLMGKKNKRSLRLSYIIKLVVFAGYKQYQKN